MDELEEMFDKIRTIIKTDSDEIKRLNKSLYDKEGELSRTKSLLDKERQINTMLTKKLNKLHELFKGVK
ncbi:hypothetical protein LCGC14_2997320 [marine sediment metagenome]|uniref:Uncharacterized protein n=1 Tax=marine sediment metagenome TaxID=412755 RepID=A0A0F8V7X5_9ZZZZ